MNAGPLADVDFRSFVGKSLENGYLLEDYLAEGNFGAVFRSTQRFLDVPVRRVALKLSKATGLDLETARDLFQDAFVLAGAIDEIEDREAVIHLTQVYEVGIAHDLDQRGFLAMEFVAGTTLAAKFESFEGVPQDQLVTWAIQTCRALAALHRLVPPLLHRDLKPDNILLGSDLKVRLVDFGLSARLLAGGYVPGSVGVVKYMAPETIQGESVPASDVYSLGVVMYEGLTGRRPHDHVIPPPDLPASLESGWAHEQRAKVRVVPPSHYLPGIRADVDELLLKCLEFKPSSRFRDAAALLKALQALGGEAAPHVELGRRVRELEADGDVPALETTIREGLARGDVPKSERYELRRKLAELLRQKEQHAEAAAELAEAWRIVEGSAVLRSIQERVDLLTELAALYEDAENPFQAVRYRARASRELSGE